MSLWPWCLLLPIEHMKMAVRVLKEECGPGFFATLRSTSAKALADLVPPPKPSFYFLLLPYLVWSILG